jgi:hypothetical protein
MNTIKTGIKSWKTTLIAIITAVVLILQDVENIDDWKTWVFPALITALGILMRDADKSSESSGLKK